MSPLVISKQDFSFGTLSAVAFDKIRSSVDSIESLPFFAATAVEEYTGNTKGIAFYVTRNAIPSDKLDREPIANAIRIWLSQTLESEFNRQNAPASDSNVSISWKINLCNQDELRSYGRRGIMGAPGAEFTKTPEINETALRTMVEALLYNHNPGQVTYSDHYPFHWYPDHLGNDDGNTSISFDIGNTVRVSGTAVAPGNKVEFPPTKHHAVQSVRAYFTLQIDGVIFNAHLNIGRGTHAREFEDILMSLMTREVVQSGINKRNDFLNNRSNLHPRLRLPSMEVVDFEIVGK